MSVPQIVVILPVLGRDSDETILLLAALLPRSDVLRAQLPLPTQLTSNGKEMGTT